MKQIMFISIFVGSLAATITMAATPTQSTSQTESKTRAMGICLPVPYLMENTEPGVGAGADYPQHWARDYFQLYENRTMHLPDAKAVKVVRFPQHGSVSLYKRPWDELMSWRYVPNGGYEGEDRVEYEVNVEGQTVRLLYFIHVTKKNLNAVPSPVFCKENEWKISFGFGPENYWARAIL